MESIYKSILEKKFINSGFLYGPLCPIYGFGAVIMILLLGNLKNNVLIIFLASTVIFTIWEYIVGILLEKIFKTKYWDYSDLKFNLKGRICLKNSICWGILGIILNFLVHPFIADKVALIPENISIYILIIIYFSVLTDVIVTVSKILFIDKKINELYEISNKLKEKIEELKQVELLEKVSSENIVVVINDLKEKQAIVKAKIYKTVNRLKKAFPTMQSEAINKLLNLKMDLKNMRNNKRKNKEE